MNTRPGPEWMPPWVRGYRLARRRLFKLGVVCWLRGHRVLVDHESNDLDAEHSRRVRRGICTRCGLTTFEERSERHGLDWEPVPLDGDLIEWLFPEARR
jgi:hypothetical protein